MLLGAHSPPAPYESMAGFHRLETAIGRRLDIVHLFQAWGDRDTAAFRTDWIEASVADGRRVLLTWEPWAPPAGFEQPGFALGRIVDGTHDRYVETWASGLADIDRPVWLRPMHEMNGTWYPWAGGIAGNTPELYVAGWRHIHGIFRRAGATRVRWVWAPNTPDVPVDNRFERYYPGASYVDVLGLDGYNWGAGAPDHGGWRSFDEIFSGDLDRIGALGSQPVWITETASCADGGDKAAWVRDMMAFVRDRPRIEAVVWFDVLKERDWRMTVPAEAPARFTAQGSSRA
ncbi:MAG: glycoside hydrolase family 26 protein [Acidimicrobiales bacterium]